MKKLLFACLVTLIWSCGTDSKQNETYKFLVGTFTTDLGWVKGKGEGIYIIEVDPKSDSLKIVQTIKDLENPAYLASNEDGSQIYVANEIVDTVNNYPARICHLERDSSGRYAKPQEGGSYGKAACHIALNSTRTMYAVTNYNEGQLAYGSLTPTGDMELNIKNRLMSGSSVNAARQGASHLHMSKFFDNDKRLIVTDLGSDSLRIFSVINNDLSAVPSFAIATDPGDGSRHLDISKDNKYIYVINELSNSITTYEYYAQSNTMKKASKVTTLPQGFIGQNTTSHILLSPDGKYIFAGNRGHNSIASFSVGEKGNLTLIGHYPTEGEVPRNFTVTKDGKYLIAGNQNSDSVILYSIGNDGKLTKAKKYSLPTPVCFVEIK
jgi:6-phosphogluconolactonase